MSFIGKGLMHRLNDHQTLLDGLVQRRPLGLISDLDGTLSQIAPTPDAATITPRAQRLLAALSERLALTALVSGRAAADLRQRAGLASLVYVGNHGLERWERDKVHIRPEAAAYRPNLQAALSALEPQLLPGMMMEDKGVTASVHYRQTAAPETIYQTMKSIVEQIAAAHGLRASEGRMIFEIRPPIEIDKGTAFRELVTEYRLAAAIFMGDDTTDADALRVARQLRESGVCYTVAVGVEASGTPDVVRASSDFMVPGVEGAEDFLAWLLDALSASDT